MRYQSRGPDDAGARYRPARVGGRVSPVRISVAEFAVGSGEMNFEPQEAVLALPRGRFGGAAITPDKGDSTEFRLGHEIFQSARQLPAGN